MRTLFKGAVPLLFSLLFILFSSVILGDNVAESLLLSNFSTGFLPVMFMFNAVGLFLISLFFMTLIDRLDRGKLLFRFLLFHAVGLLIFRALIAAGWSGAYPALYTYAYVTKIICFLVFWTVANDVISTREAKEAFPVIASGGVLGGVLVSFSVLFLLRILGTDDLLLVWSGLILLSLPLVLRVVRKEGVLLKAMPVVGAPQSKRHQIMSDFKMVNSEALLKNMAAVYFLVFILIFAHDFLFLSTLKQAFLSAKAHFAEGGRETLFRSALAGEAVEKVILKREIPRFLGLFKGLANLTTFLLQLTVAGFFLKRLGTARAMLIMPAVFGLTFLAVLLLLSGLFDFPTPLMYPFFGNALFFTLCISVVLRIAAFDSVYSPNFQLFFSTLSKEIRGRGKIFLEGIIKPAAILFSGLIILSVFPLHLYASVAILFFLTLVLLWRCLSMKRVYSESIYRFLGGGKDEQIRLLLNRGMHHADASTLRILQGLLRDTDQEIADFAFSSLMRIPRPEAESIIRDELTRVEVSRKAQLLSLLMHSGERRFIPFFLSALVESSPQVLEAALLGLRPEMGNHRASLESVLLPMTEGAPPVVRATAILVLWQGADVAQRSRFYTFLEKMVASPDPEENRAALSAVAGIGDSALFGVLLKALLRPHRFAEGKDSAIMDEFIRAAGCFQETAAVRFLLSFIEGATPNRLARIEAGLKESLPAHPDLLLEVLFSPHLKLRQCAVRVLLLNRTACHDALKEELGRLAEMEMGRLYRTVQLAHLLRRPEWGDEADVLSGILLQSCVARNFHHLMNLFRLLSPGDFLSSAADKLTSPNKHIRSSAVELIENNLDGRLAKQFIPLVESETAEVAELAKSRWHFHSPDDYLIFEELSRAEDRFARAFALYTAFQLSNRTGNPNYLVATGCSPEEVQANLTELMYG